MKANLNLFSDLMSMPDTRQCRDLKSVLKSYIWSDGVLNLTASGPNTLSQINWKTESFSFGTKGKVLRIEMFNHSSITRHVKLFFESEFIPQYQQYAYISPQNDCIFIFNEKNIQLVNGTINGEPIKQCAVFPAFELKKKMKANLKKGKIEYKPIARGAISSMFSLETEIPQGESVTAWAWAVQGKTNHEVLQWNDEIKKNVLALS
ncbi:hypothetical protein SAMN05877753_102124 [Bacillus oleivorans]|uniref:Uncharacterized protein n=1 Tax=Bacillus oleivorans TaxID=1448271 RepID=A0A285CK69_9BACI|nr:hypothetical protein [Bacillus oleivorans]SNX67920.1 hypothetical protein SAMN05877753_102124 [Bacillus oleivorans]